MRKSRGMEKVVSVRECKRIKGLGRVWRFFLMLFGVVLLPGLGVTGLELRVKLSFARVLYVMVEFDE